MAKFTNLDASSKNKFIDTAQRWGRNVLTTAQRLFNRLVKSGSWDLRTEIDKNPWKSDPHGGAKAKEWFNKEVVQHPEWFVKRSYMEPGKLYSFRYLEPLTKDNILWWDSMPLTIAFGHYISEEGNVVEMGLNLHHVPMGCRIDTLCAIVDAFKKMYQGELYRDKQKAIPMKWQQVAGFVKRFGVEFAFRSYRPELMSGTICFPYEQWSKAVFLPSVKYEKLNANQILQIYLQYLKDKRIPYQPTDLRMS